MKGGRRLAYHSRGFLSFHMALIQAGCGSTKGLRSMLQRGVHSNGHTRRFDPSTQEDFVRWLLLLAVDASLAIRARSRSFVTSTAVHPSNADESR